MILTEISWQDIIDGKKVPDSPARKAFREAVEIVAEKGRNALPALNGRIDKAVQIVLNGDISIDSNGEGTIASQSNGNGVYAVGKGDCCSCKDHPKAIKGLCKHILAFHIYTRARALAREKLEALDSPAAKAAEPVEPVVEVPVEPVTPVVPIAEPLVESAQTVSQVTLPEAPASANVYITIAGRNVQLTLRDHDEEHLLSRMEKLLERFPSEAEAEPAAGTTPPENWCPIHQVWMKRYSNHKGSWFSHRLDNKNWCNGKGKGK